MVGISSEKEEIEILLEEYSATSGKLNYENTLIWNKFNNLLLFTTILATAATYSYINDYYFLLFFLSISGLVLSSVFGFIIHRGRGYTKWWRDRLIEIEQKIKKDNEPILKTYTAERRIIFDEEGKCLRTTQRPSRLSTETLTYILIGLLLLIWFLVFLASILLLMSIVSKPIYKWKL